MVREWDIRLIKDLEELFADRGASIEKISGRDVLVMEYEEEEMPEDCNIFIEHVTEDSTEVCFMFTVASGLDEKTTEDISALLPFLNRFLSIGSFGIVRQDGFFYFNYSLTVSEQTKKDILMKIITVTLDIAAKTAEEAAVITAPVLNGEVPAAELLNEGISIIQF